MITDMESARNALADPGRGVLLDRMHEDYGQTLGQHCERFPLSNQTPELGERRRCGGHGQARA
jgi:hypothetical protein